MTTSLPCLDLSALLHALDAERLARGMTWAAIAGAVHVSVATLRAMPARGNVEADAAVLILQWLGRRCAEFTVHPPRATQGRTRRVREVPVPPLFARFDTIALHAALDRVRGERGLAWDQVAAELGVSASVIARFRKGGRTNANLMVAAADWAGEPVEALLQPSRPVLGHARMDAPARAGPQRQVRGPSRP